MQEIFCYAFIYNSRTNEYLVFQYLLNRNSEIRVFVILCEYGTRCLFYILGRLILLTQFLLKH